MTIRFLCSSKVAFKFFFFLMSITTPITGEDSLGFQPCDLQARNTLGLPCQARRTLELTSLDQLPAISRLAAQGERCVVLGGGSNVVLPERLDNPVLLVAFRGIRLLHESEDAWIIEAAAGEAWPEFVRYCIDQGWPGLENLALIPGTVGAAPVQNIGAYGVQLADRIESVTAWHVSSVELFTLAAGQCGFAYRDSIFKKEPAGAWIITSVRFRLPKPWVAVIKHQDIASHPVITARAPESVTAAQIFDAVCQIRQAKFPDPALLGNAGSFFINPVVTLKKFESISERFTDVKTDCDTLPDGQRKLAAGRLIDQAGWKGRREGPVGVYDKHALVLVNYGGATCAQLLSFAKEVSASVQELYGVTLEMEPVVLP